MVQFGNKRPSRLTHYLDKGEHKYQSCMVTYSQLSWVVKGHCFHFSFVAPDRLERRIECSLSVQISCVN